MYRILFKELIENFEDKGLPLIPQQSCGSEGLTLISPTPVSSSQASYGGKARLSEGIFLPCILLFCSRRISPISLLQVHTHCSWLRCHSKRMILTPPLSHFGLSPAAQSPATEYKSPALGENSITGRKNPGPAEPGEADFSCSVCLDLAVNPVILSCGFLCCQFCLANLIKYHQDNGDDSATCPVLGPECKQGKISQLPEVSPLLKSIMLSRFEEQYKKRESEMTEHQEIVKVIKARKSPEPILNAAGIHAEAVQRHGLMPWPESFRKFENFFHHWLPLGITALLYYLIKAPKELHPLKSNQLVLLWICDPIGWTSFTLLRNSTIFNGSERVLVDSILPARFKGYRSNIVSRHIFPYERLLLASTMDFPISFFAMWWSVTWSITTFFLALHSSYGRINARSSHGAPMTKIIIQEILILISHVALTELYNAVTYLLGELEIPLLISSFLQIPCLQDLLSLLLIVYIVWQFFLTFRYGCVIHPSEYRVFNSTLLDFGYVLPFISQHLVFIRFSVGFWLFRWLCDSR